MRRQRRQRPIESSRMSTLIDRLEPRRLLAAVINGTNGDDTFVVSVDGDNNINLIFNGQPQTIGAPGDGFAEINGLGGDDSITLLNTGGLFWDLSGGEGNDHHVVGSGNIAVDITRNLNIQTGGDATGINTIVVNNTTGSNLLYDIDGIQLTYFAIGTTTIQLGNGAPGDRITLQSGSGDDLLRVTALPENIVIDMGAGDDTVDLAGTDNILGGPGELPASSRIDGGASGLDVLIVDDSNPASPRTSVAFDDIGLVGGPGLDNFRRLSVLTHQLANGEPQTVTFRGNASIAPFVTVVGSAGPDVVQIGEPGFEAFLPLFAEGIFLNLGGGLNSVNLFDQPTTVTRPWLIDDDGLHFDSGAGVLDVSAAGVINLTLNSTDGNDVFTIQDMPGWNITVNGGGGNDLIRQGTIADMDAVFDAGRISFTGGAGVDTVDLDDTNDLIGNGDDYEIAETFVTTTHGATGQTEAFVEYFDTEHLALRLNNDPNVVEFDLSAVDSAEIHGNGGNDEFRNRQPGSSLPKAMASTLCDNVTLNGGIGLDILTLSDADASSTIAGAEYRLDVNTFAYRVGSTTRNVAFESFTTLDLIGSDNGDDTVIIDRKPLVAFLTVASGAGDDTFSIGGGDLDDSGLLTNSGVTLSAGTGNDNITFDDRLDVDEVGETETYTLGNLTIAKGTAQLVYSTFESQTLLVADRVLSGQFNTVPVVNINAVSGFLNSTTIIGGLNRGSTVNVGNSNLTNIAGTLNLHDCTTVALLDAAVSTARTYTLTAGGMTAPRPINYLNCGTVTLQASQSNDTINVRGTPVGTMLTVNANAGADAVFVGFGNLSADLQGAVSVNGGTGDNSIRFDNAADPSPAIQSMTGSTFTDGLVHGYTGFATVTVVEGPGGTNLSVNSTSTRTVINGGSGDDLFTVGGGDVDANLRSTPGQALLIDGVAGNDSIVINDLNDTNVDSYFFERFGGQDRFRKQDAGIDYFIDWLNIDGVTLEASNAPTPGGPLSGIVVVDTATPLRINGNAGNDWVQVLDASAPVTVNTGLGDRDLLHVNDSDGVTLTVIVDQSDDVEGLLIRSGGTLRVTSGAVLTKTRIATFPEAITIIGVLDLAGGALLSRAGGPTPAAFRNQIASGRNGGAWDGTAAGGAINSSLAAASTQGDGVGYGLGSEIGITSIGGFAINSGDTLVRYTLDGDADLNGSVNIADFSRVAGNFNGLNRVWTQGDNNYDGSTNIADFAGLASNFNQAFAPLARAAGVNPFGVRRIGLAEAEGAWRRTNPARVDDLLPGG